jgi:hypothetical protein
VISDRRLQIQLSPRSQNNNNNNNANQQDNDNLFRQKSAEYMNQPSQQQYGGWAGPPPLPVTQTASQFDPSLSEILRRPPVGTINKGMPLNRTSRFDPPSKFSQYPELMGFQPVNNNHMSNLNYNPGKQIFNFQFLKNSSKKLKILR